MNPLVNYSVIVCCLRFSLLRTYTISGVTKTAPFCSALVASMEWHPYVVQKDAAATLHMTYIASVLAKHYPLALCQAYGVIYRRRHIM